jgi:asparagine synthase (glutamine-hydrolysing)
MCGIAGFISLNGGSGAGIIDLMTGTITHRGPDGSGAQTIKNVTIGHRRLSIIDIETGSQPMSSQDGSIWITYNGELYNYLEIKDELNALGASFRTKSDTEVIIKAYEKWGVDCLKKFRGMFAFGIVDSKRDLVFIARDHFGIKPVYLYKDDTSVAFASELQQFTKLPTFDRSIDKVALDNYLWLQYIPAPLTIFKKVGKLKPAHYITVSFDGRVSEQRQYWDVSYSNQTFRSRAEWLEATGSAVRDSVKAHLVSDVPFGAFLSGGIDSTLVVKYMSELMDKQVKTFSIGFQDPAYNELEYSRKASETYRTDHHTEIVTPDALKLLPDLVRHYGEPFGDSSAIPTYYVSELARRHVTMVLSGDGGDECFAGYASYMNWQQSRPVNYRKGVKRILYPFMEKLMPRRYASKETLDNWLSIVDYLNRDWREALWRPEHKESMQRYPEGFEALFRTATRFSATNRVQYMDLKTYMPYDILTKVDVASMCHSLEVRTPLIDKKVWEFAATIPEEVYMRGEGSHWEGKLLLKELLMKDFPGNFINRKKQGFAVPLEKWFSGEGEWETVINEKLLAGNSMLYEYFEPAAVSRLKKTSNTKGLWLLLFLEEWLKQFKEQN